MIYRGQSIVVRRRAILFHQFSLEFNYESESENLRNRGESIVVRRREILLHYFFLKLFKSK